MNEPVLDSSAVLAVLLAEPGAERVMPALPGALLSAVNLAEIIGKLAERGMPAEAARTAIAAIGVELVDFDAAQACLAGALRPDTRAAGLSLGDRACLALARLRGVAAVTADAAWARLPDFDIVLIRGERSPPA
jgi:PIN domain nuclease of toxin-antitoxin system